MEYPFIAIAPRFTRTRSGSTWKGPIYGSNRTVLIFKLCAKNLRLIDLFEIELFDPFTMYKQMTDV